MARKPRNYDAELQAIMDRKKKVMGEKTTHLGELVQVTGADAMSVEALAGVLLAAVEQAKKQPEAIARWTERGQAFFQGGRKRGAKAAPGTAAGASDPAGGAAGDNGEAQTPGGSA